jgi:FtsP/CotA-like multicopper oxidase with cupredoxin domain
LINDLPPNRDVAPLNTDQPHKLNTTNFHFHGSHVSPGGISDNILRQMDPGQSYDVEITLPADHTRGTYWYHPHHHGGADVQIASGMAGAIVVEGDFAEVPEIAAARERLIVLHEVVFDALRTVESFETLWPETATRFVAINGQREPIIRLRPGEMQRWRIVHTGYQNDLLLALGGHPLHAIAYDGITLAALDTQDTLLMAPGQRADVLVQAGAPGTYELRALPHDQGYPSPAGPVARVVVEGEPLPMALPASLPSPPLETIADAELTGTRQLTFSAHLPEFEAAGYWQEFDFLVDGRLFDPERVDQRVLLNAVEEWTVANEHEHDHVFHIHINPFQVTKINGERLTTPVWRDTVILPRHGSVTFRSRFLDYTGRYVLHCHMMNHEEMGMMQMVEVTDAAGA